eukprot:CAMPEP_0119572776 /NCGR_PEP_ID=MMETSP1352-20130426/44793_1 /TAXON_ID=265584 /ORGANISM="Stauroneis constricta, Strain CCMP1120" /LENGTH=424 /DNA_ID=CAMNT_0007622463 /DNA_START=43 /DNA_END=1315 /DNA_ORIENTATION=-
MAYRSVGVALLLAASCVTGFSPSRSATSSLFSSQHHHHSIPADARSTLTLPTATHRLPSNGLPTASTKDMAASFVSSALFASSSSNDGAQGKKSSFLAKILAKVKGSSSRTKKPAESKSVFQRIASVHNPKTYLALSAFAAWKWDWCLRSIFYWLGVAFCVKWYRARYVFNIPVWDRQPNWNNVITSKEQEDDLKAFTCKNCGSTLFIAKTREFFFEGGTGLGGLGCFTCGAKGADNFVMDRDRIVEDVGDLDDYFEYERPLDFVSRAERRKLMKEAGGDEEKANQILLERETTPAAELEAKKAQKEKANGEVEIEESPDPVPEGKVETKKKDVAETESETTAPKKKKKKKKQPKETEVKAEAEADVVAAKSEAPAPKQEEKEAPKPPPAPKAKEPAPPAKKAAPPAPSDDDFDFDILGMDGNF